MAEVLVTGGQEVTGTKHDCVSKTELERKMISGIWGEGVPERKEEDWSENECGWVSENDTGKVSEICRKG